MTDRVGVAGTGLMGRGMAKNILAARTAGDAATS